MKEKETYQAPALEELESSLECLIVHGEGEGSGMGESEPDPDQGL